MDQSSSRKEPAAAQRMDALFSDAEDALSSLAQSDLLSRSHRSSQSPNSKEEILPLDPVTPLDIEIGRIPFDSLCQSSARPGTIFSLGKPPSPAVVLYQGERKVAEGVLMVRDGELCIRISQLADPS